MNEAPDLSQLGHNPDSPEASGAISEPRVPFRLFALKYDDTFLVADANGNVLGEGDGLFHDDTRILSRFVLTLGGKTPTLLGASVSQDNVFFTTNLTNRPLPPLGGRSTPESVIHIERRRLLWGARLYERIILSNFASIRADFMLEIEFAADFHDMFEVRGMKRAARGRLYAPLVAANSITLEYEGLDHVARASSISFSREPEKIDAGRAEFSVGIDHDSYVELYIEIGAAPTTPSIDRFRAAAARATFGMRGKRRRGAVLRSSDRTFHEWMDKSRADLALLTTELPTGSYPYAGIPWFSTPFGRDAIITAMQVLWLDPSLAQGVLRFLAEHQAQEASTFEDSAPGKIMHETRKGEMVGTREVPFGHYYGGVDTTPLFVMLAGAYAERTGDLAFIESIWPALRKASEWIEGAGDSNGDGLIDYQRGADSGLSNQGWKDSQDSIFHADGSDPAGPIALVEVQGYCYAALKAMAEMSARRKDDAEIPRWRAAAEKIRALTEEKFWMNDQHFYALAYDGAGRACRVRATNAGHLLYVGLPTPARARHVIDQLLHPVFNSGWGLRTLARGEVRYNPMSYHNGSVWPHDSALCAAGMARYGERDGVVKLMSEAFQAAVRFDMRLPELFCGFFRRGVGDAPVAYPVACLPQAWSAGSVFMLLQACLGLRIDGWRGEVHIDRPRLPIGVDHLRIRNLSIGGKTVNISVQRIGGNIVAYADQQGKGDVPIICHM